jgi:hypothetical protein
MVDKTYKLECEECTPNLYKGVINPTAITNLREKDLYKIRGTELRFNNITGEGGNVFIDNETVPELERRIRITDAPNEENIREIKSHLEREFNIKLVEAE